MKHPSFSRIQLPCSPVISRRDFGLAVSSAVLANKTALGANWRVKRGGSIAQRLREKPYEKRLVRVENYLSCVQPSLSPLLLLQPLRDAFWRRDRTQDPDQSRLRLTHFPPFRQLARGEAAGPVSPFDPDYQNPLSLSRHQLRSFFYLEEVLPVHDVRIRFNDFKPRSARMPIGGQTLEVEGNSVTVPKIDLHEVIVLEV